VTDKLALFTSSPSRKLLQERPSVEVISLYRPFLPDNEESWQVFDDDEDIDCFLAENMEDESSPSGIIDLKTTFIPKDWFPLKTGFDMMTFRRIWSLTLSLLVLGSVQRSQSMLAMRPNLKHFILSPSAPMRKNRSLLPSSENSLMFLHGHIKTFAVLILVSFNIQSPLKKEQYPLYNDNAKSIPNSMRLLEKSSTRCSMLI